MIHFRLQERGQGFFSGGMEAGLGWAPKSQYGKLGGICDVRICRFDSLVLIPQVALEASGGFNSPPPKKKSHGLVIVIITAVIMISYTHLCRRPHVRPFVYTSIRS